MLPEDRRNDEVVARALRGQGQDLVPVQARADHVVAQDVLELDRLRGGRNVLGVELDQSGVLVDDVVELALEPCQLLIGQAEAGEVRDMLDVAA